MGSPGAGTQFGPYALQSVIGIGGMGEVYRAYDTVRGRMVAVKVLRTDAAADPSFQARFRRESRIAAPLQEPHVIPVHDFGDIDGVLFIDMRLVEGPSVKDELRVKGALPPARTVAIIAQIASALDAAHASGLVHRDVKPENVLLTADDFAYLVDFGIAYGGGEASVTKTGLVIGSCAYMATERFNGKPGGPAADVYSLTCLLHECLTGREPFEAQDLAQVMSAHMFSPPPRPSVVRRGISPAFDAVVAKGMAKNPADRYASAGELARAAGAAAQAPPAAPPGRPPGTRQFTAAHPRPYAPHPSPAPASPATRSRLSRTQLVLLFGTIGMFAVAAGLAAAIVFTGGSTESRSPLAGPSPSITNDSSTTSATALAGLSGADAQGFVGHAARCDASSTLVAAIKTASSLAVICETAPGSYYYHGERLRDGANVRLADAVPAGGGFDATNPADGVRYEVRPDRLTILSGNRVDSAEPALEYGSR